MIEWHPAELNAVFGITDDTVIYLTEEDLEPIAWQNICPPIWLGRTHTEESKKLIGSYHKGKVVSEETKRKISEVQKGKPAPNRGGYGANNVRSVRWKLYHKCGKITDIIGIANWCKENGYNRSIIYDIAAGRRGNQRHKDIIKVEKLEKC